MSVRVVVPLGARGSRLPRFVTGSMFVHTVLIVTALIIPASRRRPAPIDDTMVVALAGPIGASAAPKGATSAPPAEKPAAAPAPAPPPKEAHAVKEIPKPVPKPKEKEKEKPVKPKPEPEKTTEPPGEAPTPGATEKPAGGIPQGQGTHPGTGATGVTASVGGGDSSLGWYGAAVKAALESVWIKPYLEDAQGTASVIVGFDIARDGTTRNLRIVQSSGIPSLDRSAQRAVIEASPLPAVPPQWPSDTIPVTMRFDLSAEPH